jgi:hypothetical protein
VAIAVQIQNGLGTHMSLLEPGQRITSQKAFWASTWLYSMALTTTKISILFQYLRIFSSRRFHIACYVMLAIISIYGTWTLFGGIFMCSPINFFWDKSIELGTCLDRSTVWFTDAGVNAVQDLVLLVLPIPMVRRLDIDTRLKRVLIGVFILGSL